MSVPATWEAVLDLWKKGNTITSKEAGHIKRSPTMSGRSINSRKDEHNKLYIAPKNTYNYRYETSIIIPKKSTTKTGQEKY
jgi:hypothetical protein